ncbi:hypothetical protein [Deinococcus multiflagellatus]|uniref:Uncharacterized protein n=1 Tax=Deinococcus multiflagellatus TaxID=1656887 RepID=A0ABW1ZRN0_9DEIO|nr:hypothetical protein [Deinococcus multiflagellatus]MBZ9716152.1 hypothetical protein [Deinococcus multiflagellatus]
MGPELKCRYRDQMLIGRVLLGLTAFMVLPLAKPMLWILETWGGLQVSPLVWAGLFGLTSVVLLRTRQPRWAMVGMMLAFIWLATVAAAAWLALGPNALSFTCFPLMWHCGSTSLALKVVWRQQ